MSTGKGRWVKLIFFSALFCVVLLLINLPPIDTYIASLKESDLQVIARPSPDAESDDLTEQIQALARKFNQDPVDAKIDRVWKAIPGYNGIRINEEKSIRIAKAIGKVVPEHLVIEEVEPEVTLDDLPPNPIYRGNPRKTMVSFMINVAWGTEYIEEMLDTFAEYDVKATFFLDGKWLSRNKALAQQIASEGHEIGNHAYSHPDLRQMSVKEIKGEIEQTQHLIRELGIESHLFAPPSGAFDHRVVNVAHGQKLKTILWTLDTVDWKKPSADQMVERVVPKLDNGALVLMHPTFSTIEALPRLIEGAKQKELAIGTVSEVISPARSLSIVRLE